MFDKGETTVRTKNSPQIIFIIADKDVLLPGMIDIIETTNVDAITENKYLAI